MDEQAIKILIQAMLEPILADIKELFKRTNDGSVWQAKYGEKIDTIEKNIEKLTKLIESMSKEPQKRWDTLVAAIITGFVAAVIAFIAAKLTGK